MRVLVTREELVVRVESLGHDAVFCELIRVEPLGDEPVDARGYDWLVVTSRNGAHKLGRRGVSANRVAAIGPATARRCDRTGWGSISSPGPIHRKACATSCRRERACSPRPRARGRTS